MQIVSYVKSCFLGKIRKYFRLSAAEIFNNIKLKKYFYVQDPTMNMKK